jgi:pimeloyl-ACP methyl ester carboxylesterase
LVLVSAMGGLVPFVPTVTAPDAKVARDLARSRALRTSPGFADQLAAVELVTPMLVAGKTAPGWLAHARILGMLVPPYAQAALRKHPLDNGDLVGTLAATPMLVAYGTRDPSVSPTMRAAFAKAFPTARLQGFAGAGHAPFAEQPTAFNAMLAAFVTANWKDTR